LFILYSADVKIASSHGVCIHAYTDDMQTYTSCTASDQQTATSRLVGCVHLVQQLAKLNSEPLQLKGELIMPLEKVRDLVIVIDGELNINAHARNVVRSCFYQLR